jgi:hypothetical protein
MMIVARVAAAQHVSGSFMRSFMMLCACTLDGPIAARSFTIAEQINLDHLCRTVPKC